MSHIASLSFNINLKQITLKGTLSFLTCMDIFNQSIAMINQLESDVEIDFSEINCIDSSIIALLVEWLKYNQSHRHQFHVLNLSEHIQSLLKMVELDKMLVGLFR